MPGMPTATTRSFLAFLLFAATACAGHSTPSGRWEGAASAFGASAPLTIDFSRGSHGELTARVSMTSETLWVDHPLEEVRAGSGRIHFEIAARDRGNARFDGTLRGDTIRGRMVRGRNVVGIVLHRTGITPAKSYNTIATDFTSRDGTRIRGELLIPRNATANTPAIVFLHGSGEHSREDVRFYADLFARNGFVALLADKRRYGRNPGDYNYHRLADDALAGIARLKRSPVVDPSRIGVLGISEGGWVAPIVAARDSALAFVIALVPTGHTYAENAIYQTSLKLQAAGATREEIATYASSIKRVNDYVLGLSRGQSVPSTVLKSLQLALDSARRIPALRISDLPSLLPAAGDLGEFRWQALDFDPVPYWKDVKSPVLLVVGELDRNADPRSVHQKIVPAIRSRVKTSVVEYEGVAHDLMVVRDSTHFFFPYPPHGYLDTLTRWAKGVTSRN